MRFFRPGYRRVIGIRWHKTDRDQVAHGPILIKCDIVNRNVNQSDPANLAEDFRDPFEIPSPYYAEFGTSGDRYTLYTRVGRA